jgi:ABC-type branched-subunit amino acid transport system substrate-binding protein
MSSSAGKGFEALAGELLSGNPDTVFILGSSIDTAKILQQLYKRSWSGPILISEWASNFELIEQGGPLVENSYFADMEGISGHSPKILNFKKMYGERYSEEPSIGALLGFETAEVLFQALASSGSGGAELKAELLSGLFPTVSGDLYFNPSGDIIRETVIKTIRSNEFVLAPR